MKHQRQKSNNINFMLNLFQHRKVVRLCDPEITSQAKAVAVSFDTVSATAYVNSGRRTCKLANLTLILTLTISTLVFTGVGVCVNAAVTQTPTSQTQTSAKPPLSPLTKIKTIPEKNAYELQHLEKKGFKYDFFKFLMAMLGVAVSAGAIFLGLKFYKNFVLKSKSNKIEAGDIKNSLESPKDFKEAINLFLDKTDK